MFKLIRRIKLLVIFLKSGTSLRTSISRIQTLEYLEEKGLIKKF